MRVIVEFEVVGQRPVPWKSEMKMARDGRIVAVSEKRLQGWQRTVSEAARAAMGRGVPYTGDVALEMVFIARTPAGRAHGERWSQRVEWDGGTGQSKKIDSTQPDADNLDKAVSDALAGVVMADDVQVCDVRSSRVYGPEPGVAIVVRAF